MRFVAKFTDASGPQTLGIYEAFRDAKNALLLLLQEGAATAVWVELDEPIPGLRVEDVEPEPEPDTGELREDVAEIKEDVAELERDLAAFESEGGAAAPPPLPSASAKKSSKKKWFEP